MVLQFLLMPLPPIMSLEVKLQLLIPFTYAITRRTQSIGLPTIAKSYKMKINQYIFLLKIVSYFIISSPGMSIVIVANLLFCCWITEIKHILGY